MKYILNRPVKIWLLFLLTSGLTAFFAFINIAEYISIGILERTGGYPFGGEGPTPWYYETASLYSTVSLVFGLLILLNLFFSIWAFTKAKNVSLLVSFMATVFLIILQIMLGATND